MSTAVLCFWPEAYDGPGWYYFDEEYRDEGSVGAFKTWGDAADHAEEAEYVRPMPSDESLATEAAFDTRSD